MQPQAIPTNLLRIFGTPQSFVPLAGGQSGAVVYRLRYPFGSYILKKSRHHQELHFYQAIAQHLRGQGISIPILEWSAAYEEGYWLLLEDIPQPLPMNRWQADRDVLAMLRRLHSIRPLLFSDSSQMFRPQWTTDMTEAVAGVLPPSAVQIVQAIQRRAQHLFHADCLISGDPNPTNWGLRPDGTLVLFDWERFGYGTPALDLAITIPGLGDSTIYQQVAARYLNEPQAQSATVDQLARDIGVAKLWSVVEYLAADAGTRAQVHALTAALPSWLYGLQDDGDGQEITN